jgi:hypothetical protein
MTLPELLRCDSTTGESLDQAEANWHEIKIAARSARECNVRRQEHSQIDEVRSGGSFYSQNDLRLHFGLGAAKKADRLEIRWPSGATQSFRDVAADRIWLIKEGNSIEEIHKG